MYFIYDCNNNVVGNSKGYRTHKSAATGIRYPACKAIWAAYEARANKSDNFLCSIKAVAA